MIAVLSYLDWTIIIGFLLLSLGIGLYYRKEAGRSMSDYFLGGRNLPWYVAGLSMVATTFAADTPLAVAELVAGGGISKNWLWWSFLMGGAFTTFFFAVLWRRSGVLTELEFIQLRYEGKPAFLLRLFKSVYLGLLINAVIIAWVNLAMMSLIEVFFDTDRQGAFIITLGLMLLAVLYSTISGLKGVAITDMIQFSIAMIGCIVLAVVVVNSDEVGGIAQLKATLPSSSFDFIPSIQQEGDMGFGQGFGLTIGAFLAFVAVQWWSSWYPGAEPGGGGYIAQRMMSTRSEKDAVWATLLFQVGHYCIRPWPWILVGLCAIALYSPEFAIGDQAVIDQLHTLDQFANAEDFLASHPEIVGTPAQSTVEYHYSPRLGFVFAMRDFLPSGLSGLLLVAFFAAYMSTISTQVNWGASYLVNDLVIPLTESTDQASLVKMSRFASVGIMVAGALVTPFVTSISGVWEFIMQCGAGLGLVLILRWYWWRINAWSEITATVVPVFSYAFCYFYLNERLGEGFTSQYGGYYFTVGTTTIAWVLVTYLTSAPKPAHVKSFLQKVRPMGWWPDPSGQVKARNKNLPLMLWMSLSMVVFILSTLFGLGSLMLLEYSTSVIYILLSIISVIGLRVFLKKTNIFDGN